MYIVWKCLIRSSLITEQSNNLSIDIKGGDGYEGR
jgi:hypothetical protein